MKIIFFIFLFFVNTAAFGSESNCYGLFEDATLNKSIRALAELRLKLDLATSENQDSLAINALKTEYQSKETKLKKYVLDLSLMNEHGFINRIKSEIEKLQREIRDDSLIISRDRKEHDRNMIIKSIDGSYAVFHKVRPGTYGKGEPTQLVPTVIEKPFEMMATTVTQGMWRYVIELGLRKYPDLNLAGFNLTPNIDSLVGDLKPIVQINVYAIDFWTRVLNRLSQDGEPGLKKMIPDFQKGQKFRLPSEDEWEFVVTERGTLNRKYFVADDLEGLQKYAWLYPGSNYELHDVATRTPQVIDGLEFYDLLGNVQQWLSDSDTFQIHKICGASYQDFEGSFRKGIKATFHASIAQETRGFRLVREVP